MARTRSLRGGRAHVGHRHRHPTREHGATLLHYVAANGIENYRQKTPPNIVELTKLLLDSGAAVNAIADLYGREARGAGARNRWPMGG